MSFTKREKIIVVSILVALTVWISSATIYHLSYGKKTPVERALAKQEWPESLVELIREADASKIQVKNLEVYSGPHDDYYWKCEADQGLLDLMAFRWKLHPVKGDYRVVRRVLENLPSAFLSLKLEKNNDYYVSKEYLPDGEWKGHLYCVIYDKNNNVIVVRYYYNF